MIYSLSTGSSCVSLLLFSPSVYIASLQHTGFDDVSDEEFLWLASWEDLDSFIVKLYRSHLRKVVSGY